MPPREAVWKARMETDRVGHMAPGSADGGVAPSARARAREQRLRSLAVATQTRAARAALKNELATGRARIEEVLAHPPACATTAKVADLLLALHGVGPTRVTRALARCQIPYAQTAAGLRSTTKTPPTTTSSRSNQPRRLHELRQMEMWRSYAPGAWHYRRPACRTGLLLSLDGDSERPLCADRR